MSPLGPTGVVRRGRWRRVALGAALLGGAVSVAGAAPAHAAGGGTLTVTPAPPVAAAIGGRVLVTADGLRASTEWQLQICGDGGLGNATACSQASATTAATSETGHFVVALTVLLPPVPCPCVVEAVPLRATPGGVAADASAPLDIAGSTSAPVSPSPSGPAPSGLVITRAAIVGSGSWAEWFGAPARRTLVLVLRNGGQNLIPSTPAVLRAGAGRRVDQVVAAPVVPPLPPGAAQAFRVPVTFPAFTFGDGTVRGELGGPGQVVTFATSTRLFPWGLPALAGIGLLLVLLHFVRRVRRRRRSGPEGPVDEAGQEPAPVAVGVSETGP